MCCSRSPENGKAGYFRRSHRMADGAEAVYEISVSSEETQVKAWEKIGGFYVKLRILAIWRVFPESGGGAFADGDNSGDNHRFPAVVFPAMLGGQVMQRQRDVVDGVEGGGV